VLGIAFGLLPYSVEISGLFGGWKNYLGDYIDKLF
jgi:hypothetical protein